MNPPDLYISQRSVQVDEYKKYLKIAAAPCDKPLQWWKGRCGECPSLSRMALDILSITLISVECERVFSATGYLVNKRKNNMKKDIIEATTYLLWKGRGCALKETRLQCNDR